MTVAHRITLQDIADKAGVSKATVSRALRDHSAHSAATKRKIAAAAKELGYEAYPILPAVMASVRLKRTTQVSPVIAGIHCQPAGYDREGNPASLRKSIHEQAENLGFRVEEFHWYERGLTPRRLINIVRARGIRAVNRPGRAQLVDHRCKSSTCALRANGKRVMCRAQCTFS